MIQDTREIFNEGVPKLILRQLAEGKPNEVVSKSILRQLPGEISNEGVPKLILRQLAEEKPNEVVTKRFPSRKPSKTKS